MFSIEGEKRRHHLVLLMYPNRVDPSWSSLARWTRDRCRYAEDCAWEGKDCPENFCIEHEWEYINELDKNLHSRRERRYFNQAKEAFDNMEDTYEHLGREDTFTKRYTGQSIDFPDTTQHPPPRSPYLRNNK